MSFINSFCILFPEEFLLVERLLFAFSKCSSLFLKNLSLGFYHISVWE